MKLNKKPKVWVISKPNSFMTEDLYLLRNKKKGR